MDSKSYLISGGTRDLRTREVLKLITSFNPEVTELLPAPDLFIIEGESIGIEKIRELVKKIYFKAWNSLYKIVLIKEAQVLTLEAQNALLKTLEEPPDSTVLILETAELNFLLPTIISRCLRITLNREVERELLTEAAQAKALCDMLYLLEAKISKRFEFAGELTKDKSGQAWLTLQSFLWRDLLLASLGCTKFLFTKVLEADNLEKLKKVGATSIKNYLYNIEKTKRLLAANINERLAIENLLLEMPKII